MHMATAFSSSFASCSAPSPASAHQPKLPWLKAPSSICLPLKFPQQNSYYRSPDWVLAPIHSRSSSSLHAADKPDSAGKPRSAGDTNSAGDAQLNNAIGSSSSLRVMFAAGGTGGHIYPAIAIADALKELHPSIQIEFVGTKHRLEWSAVPNAGYIIRPIPAVGIKRPLFSLENLLFPFRIIASVCIALGLLRRFRPHIVVGTGGYVSAPLCLAAAVSGCPFAIQEQNAFPGIANKVLARFASIVFVAFQAAVSYFPKGKCIVCGNPIRSALYQSLSKTVALRHFFPDAPSALSPVDSQTTTPLRANEKSLQRENRVFRGSCTGKGNIAVVILVLGGSLGAKSINMAMAGMVSELLDKHPDRFVIWQTGFEYYKEIVERVRNHPRLLITQFLEHMEFAYAATNLVVARSGAITCSELLAVRKPCILIPSCNVADDHQLKNAMVMLEAGAAKILHDSDLSSVTLEAAMNEVLEIEDSIKVMHDITFETTPNAAIRIAKEVMSLVESSTS